MLPHHIIIESFNHQRALYKSVLNPYSFIHNLEFFCTILKVHNKLNTKNFVTKFLHCVLMNEFIIYVSLIPSFAHIY
jgi:hypothetical protein